MPQENSYCAEIWRPIIGYEGVYEVAILGVRRISTGRILKQQLDRHCRPMVTLYLHGKRTTHLVAHLVADAFLPAKGPTDTVVRHINGDPSDNRACNLARGTQRDNAQDAIRHGTFPRGTTNGAAKLTENQVREIRRLYATGKCSLRELALRFGVHPKTVFMIIRRKGWKHVPEEKP